VSSPPEKPAEPDKPDKPGILARAGALVALLGGVVGLITAVVALWPEGEPEGLPSSGRIDRFVYSNHGTATEVVNHYPAPRDCPGVEEKLPDVKVSLPLATIALAPNDRGSPGRGGGETPGRNGTTGTTGPTGPPPTAPRPSDPTVDELARRAGVSTERIEDLLWNAPPGPGEDISKAETQTIIASTRLERPGRRRLEPDISAAPYRRAAFTVQVQDDPQAAPGELDPVGWIVDVHALLEHFGRSCAYVQWSLYDKDTGTRVDKEWWVNRRAVRFVTRGSADAQGSSFWVPIPRKAGRYWLKAALFDIEGTQLEGGKRLDKLPDRR
jgi:hypothetical protein